jgi:hypothetical protein
MYVEGEYRPLSPLPTAHGLSRAILLRRELSERNHAFARKYALPHHPSYGAVPTIAYEPFEDGKRHGNFLDSSYRAILANPEWSRRLAKAHSQGRRSLPQNDRGFWCELDSSNSSDALLMNVFCYPGTLRSCHLRSMLDVGDDVEAQFGVRARVPLIGGKQDATEVDMRIGSLLVEAKLTEADFQSKKKEFVERYRDLHEVFWLRMLPRRGDTYVSYQLIRNVLAAQATGSAFCVLVDARRPDLLEAWYDVLRAVKSAELRVRLKALTWQELARVLPPTLQKFLEEKYGIA